MQQAKGKSLTLVKPSTTNTSTSPRQFTGLPWQVPFRPHKISSSTDRVTSQSHTCMFPKKVPSQTHTITPPKKVPSKPHTITLPEKVLSQPLTKTPPKKVPSQPLTITSPNKVSSHKTTSPKKVPSTPCQFVKKKESSSKSIHAQTYVPSGFNCTIYKKKYKYRAGLYKHELKEHPDEKSNTKGNIKCLETKCAFTCRYIDGLRSHLQLCHGIQKREEKKQFATVEGMRFRKYSSTIIVFLVTQSSDGGRSSMKVLHALGLCN